MPQANPIRLNTYPVVVQRLVSVKAESEPEVV